MAVQNTLAPQNGGTKFSDFLGLEQVKKQLANALGNSHEVQKFASSILSAVSTNPELQTCDNATIVSSALLANSLGLSLSPQLGFAYIVPFKNKKKECIEATFILGYRGYIQLAIRSGYYKKLNVLPMKEGELVRFDPLSEEVEVRLIEDEEIREETPTVGYYAMFEYTSGFRKAMYWSRKKMEFHADKYSKAYSSEASARLKAGKIPASELWKYSSFWYKDFDGMALKTMIRQLISKWGIMSIDMQNAFASDSEPIESESPMVNQPAEQTATMPQIADSRTETAPEAAASEEAEDEDISDMFFGNNG